MSGDWMLAVRWTGKGKDGDDLDLVAMYYGRREGGGPYVEVYLVEEGWATEDVVHEAYNGLGADTVIGVYDDANDRSTIDPTPHAVWALIDGMVKEGTL